MNCIFCKIVSGEIDAKIVYKDDLVVAINDMNPQAPHHKLIIPHKHISTLNDLHTEDRELIGHMVQAASLIAKQLEMAEEGYRTVFNCNKRAGQTVFHIHLHLLGGRNMTWPPG
jgi:histidine triad (HIT) family protein